MGKNDHIISKQINSKELSELLERGFRYALSLTHHEPQAEDLLQTACRDILKKEGPWNRGYLFTTIRNRFIDEYRRAKKVPIYSLDESEDETHLEQALEEDPFKMALRKDLLHKALSILEPEEREALYLVGVEGYTFKESADLMSKPRGTLLSLVHRARKKIFLYFEKLDKEARP